jgi:hypothetical protein
MRISLIGLLLTDFNFIMVNLFPRHIPGGYWFLVVGPMVEGALGGTLSRWLSRIWEDKTLILAGLTGGIAAVHAYLADTSDESDR